MREYAFKICLLGEGGVGKTALLQRIKTGKFDLATAMTIGVEFHIILILTADTCVRLHVWDIGGQTEFHFLIPVYRRGIDAAVLMYDTTRPATVWKMREWARAIRSERPDVPIMILGTKTDLTVLRAVTAADVAPYAEELGAVVGHYECSSKDGTGIGEAILGMTNYLLRMQHVTINGPMRIQADGCSFDDREYSEIVK